MGAQELHDLVPSLGRAGHAFETAFRLVAAGLELVPAEPPAATAAGFRAFAAWTHLARRLASATAMTTSSTSGSTRTTSARYLVRVPQRRPKEGAG